MFFKKTKKIKELTALNEQLMQQKDGLIQNYGSLEEVNKNIGKATESLFDLQNRLSKGQLVARSLDEIIDKKTREYNSISKILSSQEELLKNTPEELKKAQREIIAVEYSIYRVQLKGLTSEEIKAKLDELFDRTLTMIEEGTALSIKETIALDGDRIKGKHYVVANSKLLLTYFNAECDFIFHQLTGNNFEVMRERLVNSFDKLNKLSEINNIQITNEYMKLKLEQLHIIDFFKKQ